MNVCECKKGGLCVCMKRLTEIGGERETSRSLRQEGGSFLVGGFGRVRVNLSLLISWCYKNMDY